MHFGEGDVVDDYISLVLALPSAKWSAPFRLDALKRELWSTVVRGGEYVNFSFEYDRSNIAEYLRSWSIFLSGLDELDLDDFIKPLLKVEVASKIEFAEAVIGGDVSYSAFQVSHAGRPSAPILNLARQILNDEMGELRDGVQDDQPSEGRLFSALDIKQSVEAAFQAYGLEDWRVEVKKGMAAGMAVAGRQKTVKVDSSLRVNKLAFDRLLIHEVGGHVLRWVNSAHQPYRWLNVPIGFTVPTEEGFALWHEYKSHVMSRKQLKIYAARVVAVDLAQTHGLVDVARALAEMVSIDDAIEIAIRVKRGLFDPNGPGGLAKDWAYLGGFLQVKEAIECDESSELLLAVSKWPVEHLPTLKSLRDQGSIRPPNYVLDNTALGVG